MSELTEMESLRLEAAHKEAEKELKGSEETKEVIEPVKEEEKAEERQYTEVEKEQMSKGWDPNHKGPNAVSADEYKRVGEIIEAKRKASKEVQVKTKEVEALTKTVRQLVDHNRAVAKASYEKALEDLYKLKLEKVEEGDVAGVIEVERQQANLKPPVIEDVRIEEETPQSEDISNHPEVIAFREEFKNELTGKTPSDKAFQSYVVQRATELEKEGNMGDVKEVIEMVKAELKEAFPQKFKNVNKEKPVLTEESTTYGTSSKAKGSMSRLSYEQRTTLAQIQAADPSYPTDEFIKQLELTGRLG
jgi:hypothetical protein